MGIKISVVAPAYNEQGCIEEFVTEINKERIGTKWKSVTGKVIAIKLAHIPTNDLYIFMSMCKDYKNRQGAFGKYFFGALKIK